MAIATAIMGGAQAVTGIAGGISKFFEGRKMQKWAQDKIEHFQWQDLENVYKNNQVSTLGADLQREENARTSSTAVDALREGGNRALVGGLGRIVANNNMVNRQIGANLDEQQKAIDMAKSSDDARIRDMVETRQSNELQGYGQMMNVGMGMKYAGTGDVVNGLGMAASTMGTAKAMKDGTGMWSKQGSGMLDVSEGELTPLTGKQMGVQLPNTQFQSPSLNFSGMSGGMGYGNTDMSQIWNQIQSINNRPR